MFARILEFGVRLDQKAEFTKTLKNEVLPILKKQPGFLEVLPFFPEKTGEITVVNISLWTGKPEAERYQKEVYPKVFEIVKPFLVTPVTTKFCAVETTLCGHLVEALAA